MIQKVFISADNMATFTCPRCEKPRRADVSKFSDLDQAVRIRVKCPCGHHYPVDLERRRRQRKAVNFPGVVFRVLDGERSVPRVMAVKDLSRTGLKLHVNLAHDFVNGDTLLVEFRLDDIRRSIIRREAVVRRVLGRDINASFTSADSRDPSEEALGFYFLS